MEQIRGPESKKRTAHFRHESITQKAFTTLDSHRRRELIEHTAFDTMTALAKAGFEEYENLNDLYRDLNHSDLLVRREDPERVVQAVAEHRPLNISFPEGSRYSNAVEWDPSIQPESMGNAFLEGYGMRNGIVTVVGMKKDESVDVVQLPDATQNFYGLSRARVVSMQGTIVPENIAFVIVRMPIFAFPAELMSPREEERLDVWESKKSPKEPEFIFRGYLNPHASRKTILQ